MLPALKKLRTAAGTLLGLVTVVLIAGCERSDPDATRMQNLAARGYSLSVADFHRAACAGDTLALEQFLECGTRVDVPLVENGRAQTALRAAVKNGHDGAAAFLIEQGASLAKADETDKPRLLELAIASGNESLARLLLAHPDLPRHELPPLLLEASRQGEVGLTGALLDHEPGPCLGACPRPAGTRKSSTCC